MVILGKNESKQVFWEMLWAFLFMKCPPLACNWLCFGECTSIYPRISCGGFYEVGILLIVGMWALRDSLTTYIPILPTNHVGSPPFVIIMVHMLQGGNVEINARIWKYCQSHGHCTYLHGYHVLVHSQYLPNCFYIDIIPNIKSFEV